MDGPTSESTSDATDRERWTRACGEAAARSEPVRVEILTRSVVPSFGTREYHDEVEERVRALEEDGLVDEYVVDVWGKHLPPEGRTASQTPAAERVSRFRAWADGRDVELLFQERRCRSGVIDEDYTVLVPPHVTVAVYSGDALVGVAPCRDGDEPVSVKDLLTLIGTNESTVDGRSFATS